MKRIVAAIAALVTVAAFSPAAAGATNTADAPVPSVVTPTVVTPTVVAADGSLSGELTDLAGMPLGIGDRLQATVTATNTASVAHDDVALRLDLTAEPLTSHRQLAAFLDDPSTITMRAAAQEPPVAEDTGVEETGAEETGNEAREQTAGQGDSFSQSGDNTQSDENAQSGNTSQSDENTQSDGDDEEPPEPVGVRIAPQSSRSFTLDLSAAELELPARGWGVYGASVTLVVDGADVPVDSFPVVWGGDSVPTLDLAVIAAAYGTPSRILGVLEASNLPGVATAVDATTLTNAAMFDYGLLEREVFRLPGKSPDLSSLAHAADDALVPLSLSLPAGSNVGHLDSAPWLALPAVLDGQSVAHATDLGAAAVVASPRATGFSVLATAADSAVVGVDGGQVLVPNAPLTQAVATYRPGTLAAQARAVAESALLAGEQGGAPGLVVLDQAWPATPPTTSALSALLDAPWVSPVSVAQVLAEPGPVVSLTDVLDAAGDLSEEGIAALTRRLVRLTLLSTVTASPADAVTQWGEGLLSGVAVTMRGETAARELALTSAIADADDTLAALRIAESSDLNLLAESGDIPVNLVNGLDYDVTVTVDLRSSSPNLQVLDSPVVTVPANSNVVALVPVEAVSSANVHVSTALRNAEGLLVSDVQTYSVRVRADWGNAATAVFTVMLVLLLVAGIIRTIRRGRKDTRAEPAPAPDIAPPAAPAVPAPREGDRD